MPLETARRGARRPLKVVPRFVYNPEKAERGLKAMADILAEAIRRRQTREGKGPEAGHPRNADP